MPAAIPLAAAAVGAAGSVMAAKAGAKGQQANAENANAPWKEAVPYVTDAYKQGQGFLNTATAMGTNGAYDGPRVAGLNGYQTSGADSAGDWAGNQGQNVTGALYDNGMQLSGTGAGYGKNAQSMFDMASGDHTQQFLDTASQYANNPYVDGIIDANSRDVVRNLNENQLPSLNNAAAGTGNTNSSRTGIAEGIIQRGASDRLADISSGIRSQFFSQGLNAAQDQYNKQFSQASGANEQLSDAYKTGASSLTNAQGANGTNFDQSQAAGGLYQRQDQAGLDASKQQFSEQQNNQLDLLNKYMTMIKQGQGGGSAVNTTPQSPVASGIQGALGAGLAAYGMKDKLGFGADTTTPSTPASYNFSMPNASSSGSFNNYGFTA